MAKLLIVEDDLDAATSLEGFLGALGHQVRVARDGVSGLRALEDALPDLALLDVQMPTLDGPGMAYRMFIDDAGRERVPVVLLSGVMDLERVAARVGTPYYLKKPYDAEELLALVDRALVERTAPRPF